MSFNSKCFKGSLLTAASIFSMCAGGVSASAQESGVVEDKKTLDTIIVTGIRASEQASVDIKRNTTQVVDSIVATDIGKLPDATIADSLQRIPGVQIRRSAGEGSVLNIRGLGQVGTLLNGEVFIAPSSITSVQPNFSDIPSQLFAGADVFKTLNPKLYNSGVSGTVNLKTIKPFDLDDGVTWAGAAEGSIGSETEELRPSLNGMFGYRGDKWGVNISAAYSNPLLYSSELGMASSGARRDERVSGGNSFQADTAGAYYTGSPAITRGTPIFDESNTLIGYDLNGDGDVTDSFRTPQHHRSDYNTVDRERLGLSASVQAELTNSITFTGDVFYSEQDEFSSSVRTGLSNVRWQRAHYTPGAAFNTGADVDGYTFHLPTVFNFDLPNFDVTSSASDKETKTTNVSLKLDFDNDGKFRGSARAIFAEGSRKQDNIYFTTSLSNGYQWADAGYNQSIGQLGVMHYPDGDRAFNPNGYTVLTLPATVDYTSGAAAFTLPQELLGLLGDANNYAVKTLSSENNAEADSEAKAIRLDGEYDLNEEWTIASGVRYGERDTENYAFDRIVDRYPGVASVAGGCPIKWRANDVRMNSGVCSALDENGFPYTAGLPLDLNDFSNSVTTIQGEGVGVPAVLALDPEAFRDIPGFMENVDPGNYNVINPGNSYEVGVEQMSAYLSADFDGQVGRFPVRANLGVQYIDTTLNIRQNLTGASRPYGLAQIDAGDQFSERSFTDTLPTASIAVDVWDNLVLRASYAKTMTLLNLANWGGGLRLNYGLADDDGSGQQIFAVVGGSQGGSPDLDPWRSSNFDVALEWYNKPGGVVSVGFFSIEVDSFIQSGSITRTDLADQDGVVRGRTVDISSPVQGDGATLEGLEFGVKQPLDMLPGFLSNLGVDANYTLALSEQEAVDLFGSKLPFSDNSEHQTNFVLWYDDGKLELRAAHNYRSERLAAVNVGAPGNARFQEPTNYIDLSASYEVSDGIDLYGQISNLTEQGGDFYLSREDAPEFDRFFERQFRFGVRARF